METGPNSGGYYQVRIKLQYIPSQLEEIVTKCGETGIHYHCSLGDFANRMNFIMGCLANKLEVSLQMQDWPLKSCHRLLTWLDPRCRKGSGLGFMYSCTNSQGFKMISSLLSRQHEVGGCHIMQLNTLKIRQRSQCH